ncbi:MAG: hypothetical protein IKV99_04005 [Oscillospiraceae bacterium]|nr:hypothetical protein [Oscillospiraceae bacterium]
MDGWNFHGFIALPLETYANKLTNGEYTTADEIEQGDFVDVMLGALSIAYGNLEKLDWFVEVCQPFDKKPASEISKEDAERLFREFEILAKKKLEEKK